MLLVQRVRRRDVHHVHGRVLDQLAEEFAADKKEAKTSSPLFRNLEHVVLGSEQAAAKIAPKKNGALERIKELLEQAGVALTPVQLLAIAGGLGVVAGALLAWWRGPILGTAAAALGTGAPWIYLLMRRAARRETMLKQLPSVFDLMARAIRASCHRRPRRS